MENEANPATPGGSAVTSPATAADNTATADPATPGGSAATSGGQAGEAILTSQTGQTGQTDQNGEQDTAILVPDPASPFAPGASSVVPFGDYGGQAAVTSGGKEQGASVPEQYEEFRMPEGFVLEGETKEKVTGLFRELNLSQESAQKLVDYATERDLAGREAMLNELAAKRKEWRSSLRARPNFEADLALARKGMKALVRTPEGAELFNGSWMSDHPAVFDIFVRAGRLVAEDTFDNQNGGSVEENVNLRRFPVK